MLKPNKLRNLRNCSVKTNSFRKHYHSFMTIWNLSTVGRVQVLKSNQLRFLYLYLVVYARASWFHNYVVFNADKVENSLSFTCCDFVLRTTFVVWLVQEEVKRNRGRTKWYLQLTEYLLLKLQFYENNLCTTYSLHIFLRNLQPLLTRSAEWSQYLNWIVFVFIHGIG